MPPSVGSVEMTNSIFSWASSLPAHAVAVLFLHGADYHDPIPCGDQIQVLHNFGAVHCRGHAALLVGAAPAKDDVVCFIALIGVCFPVVGVANTNGVDVGIDGDDLVSAAHPADDVAQTVNFHLVKAQLFHLGLDAVHHILFFAAFAGVGDHFPQEPGHVGLIASGRCLDRFKIHHTVLQQI